MCFRPPSVDVAKVCEKCGMKNEFMATACVKCGEALPEQAAPGGPAGMGAPGMPSAPGMPAAPGMPKAPGSK